MSADSPAEDPTPSTVGGLNTEKAATIGIEITDEDVWSHGATRRAPAYDTLTGWDQIDPEFSPEDSDTNSSGLYLRRTGCWSSHLPPWPCAHQRSPPRHDWRPT